MSRFKIFFFISQSPEVLFLKLFHFSMQAWKSQHEMESKVLNTQRRKRKLADLLKKENAMYEVCMRTPILVYLFY